MKQKRIKYLLGTLLLIAVLGLLGFVLSKESVESPASPAIDFAAIAVANDGPTDHSQVLLRMSVVNYTGDILKLGLTEPAQHQERLHYFFSDFKSDVHLISGSDTIPCLDAHFERTYMDAPYRNFILNFNRATIEKDDQLLIADRIYSDQFLKVDINQQP